MSTAQSHANKQSGQRSQQYMQSDISKVFLDYLSKKGYHRTEATFRNESGSAPVGFDQKFPVTPENTPVLSEQPIVVLQRRQHQLQAESSAGMTKKVAYKLISDKTTESMILNKHEHEIRYVPACKMFEKWVLSSLDILRPKLTIFMAHLFQACYKDMHKSANVSLEQQKEFQDRFLAGIDPETFVNDELSLVIEKDVLYHILYFLMETKHVGGDDLLGFIHRELTLKIKKEENGAEQKNEEGPENKNAGSTEETEKDPNEEPQEVKEEQDVSAEKDNTKVKEEEESEKKDEIEDVQEADAAAEMKTEPEESKKEDAAAETGASEKSATESASEGENKDVEMKDDTEQHAAEREDAKEPGQVSVLSSVDDDVYIEVDVQNEVKLAFEAQQKLRFDFKKSQFTAPSVCMYTFHNSEESITCLEFDGRNLVAAGFEDSYIGVWTLDGSKTLKNAQYCRLIGHSGTVYGLSFSPDSKYLLSCSEDGTVRLWSLESLNTICVYKGHNDPIWDVKFSPFGQFFVTASHDTSARFWSVDHLYNLRVFAGHLSDVDCVEWFPNSCYCFTGSSDKTIRMWDVLKGETVRLFLGHKSNINKLAVSPDGKILASGGDDAVINVWNISTGKMMKSMKGHAVKSSIYGLAFSKDGNTLMSCGSDSSVRVWNVKKKLENNLSEPEPFVKSEAKDAAAGVGGSGKSAVGGSSGGNGANSAGSAGDSSGDGVPQSAGGAKEPEKKKKDVVPNTSDHFGVYFAKKANIVSLVFTEKNVCLAGGLS